jgi:hypothetical protein
VEMVNVCLPPDEGRCQKLEVNIPLIGAAEEI